MWEKQQPRRFYGMDCDGRPCIRIQNHIVGHEMHAKGLTDPHAGMSCHLIRRYHYSPLRSG